MEKIVTWKFAHENKLPHYFTGNPCKRGHISRRYTSNCGCVDCVNPKTPNQRKLTEASSSKNWAIRHKKDVYYSRIKCPNGHYSDHRVADNACCACVAMDEFNRNKSTLLSEIERILNELSQAK
jgi:hypothetical protein